MREKVWLTSARSLYSTADCQKKGDQAMNFTRLQVTITDHTGHEAAGEINSQSIEYAYAGHNLQNTLWKLKSESCWSYVAQISTFLWKASFSNLQQLLHLCLKRQLACREQGTNDSKKRHKAEKWSHTKQHFFCTNSNQLQAITPNKNSCEGIKKYL